LSISTAGLMAKPTPDDARRIVDKFHMSTFDERLWDPAIDDVKSVLGASLASLSFVDVANQSSLVLRYDGERAFTDLFVQMGAANPIFGVMKRQPVGTSRSEAQFLDRGVFERGAFFNEWARPQGLSTSLFARISGPGSTHGQLVLLRALHQPIFDTDDVAFLDRIAPDIARVAQLRYAAGKLSLHMRLKDFDVQGIGAVAVDTQGRIFAQNCTAGDLLAGGQAVSDRRGRIIASLETDQPRLGALVAAAAPRGPAGGHAGDMLICCAATGQPLVGVSVLPIPDGWSLGLPVIRAALILLRPVRPDDLLHHAARVAAIFDLTPKETELAACLMSGRGLYEAAVFRGIGRTTARTQLAQLFRKTGTSRQAELVVLLLGVLPRV
jgi:DNA-binding CsgD family transcriptional regulator